MFMSIHEPVQYTDVTMAVYAVAAVVLSYGFAAVVAVFVEFPLSNVEATVFKILGFSSRESTRRITQAQALPGNGKREIPESPPPLNV